MYVFKCIYVYIDIDCESIFTYELISDWHFRQSEGRSWGGRFEEFLPCSLDPCIASTRATEAMPQWR